MSRLARGACCFIAAAGAFLLAACNGSGNNGPNPGIFVTFDSALPASVNVGGNFMIAAIVTEDGSHSGVNWTATCGGASCGSFSATHTASGTATTYSAPDSVPAGSTVSIMATAAADSTRAAAGNVIISAGTEAITFAAPPPPVTLSTSAGFNTASLAAVVTNDLLNQGVDWSVTCGTAGACGGFSSAHTASTVSTTFTAPPAIPAGGTVTITAASTTSPAVTVSTVVTLSASTPAAFLCAGCNYTYFVSGTETSGASSGSFYTIAGVFTADGMGNITAGEQDFSDVGFSTGNTPDHLTGHYTFGPDGRGTITLNNGDGKILNGSGVETLSAVFLSSSQMLITELDNAATGSGTMDLQSTTSFTQSTLSGGYAFVFSGSDVSSSVPLGFGGVFNVDSAGGISGAGSVADANASGAVSTQQGLNGSYPMPDSSGRVMLTLHSSVFGNVGLAGPAVMACYIKDAAHLKCMELDSNFGITAGLAVGQGTNTGKLGSASVLPVNTSYVFSTFGSSGSVFGPISLAATFTSDGVSNLQNGVSDVNNGGVPSSGTLTGTYAVAASGVGRVAVTLSGNTSALKQFAMYLTGGPDPAMVLELDARGVTSGLNYQKAASTFNLASFQGNYGLNYSAFNPAATAEEDVAGQLFADGAGSIAATLDVNANGVPVPNAAASGSYASASSGRFTGSLNSTPTGAVQLSYYLISPSQIVITQTDTNGVTLGLFQLQTPPF
jgi:hypothetical protein